MAAVGDLTVVLVLFLVLFGGSTYLAAMPLRREVARAVRRQEALPRIANWWRGVLARAWWIVGAGVALIAGGAFLWTTGAREAGGYALLLGLALGAYVVQAAFLVRVIDRTIRRETAAR